MIVVGVDFSEASAHAFAVARRMGDERGTPVHVVHVRRRDGLPASGTAARRRAWLEHVGDHPPTIEEREGVPWVELIHAAEERRAYFLVAGTHGQSGYQPLRLGCTATQLALRSLAPVVLVPPRPSTTIESDRPITPIDTEEPR